MKKKYYQAVVFLLEKDLELHKLNFTGFLILNSLFASLIKSELFLTFP